MAEQLKKRTVVNVTEGDLKLKLSPKDTMILVFPDEFEYSCVVHSDQAGEDDPTLIFDPKLMGFLAVKGFYVARIEDEVPEYIMDGYAVSQSEIFAKGWLEMTDV